MTLTGHGNVETVRTTQFHRRKPYFKTKIVWFNVIGFLVLHLLTLYEFCRAYDAMWQTLVYSYMVGIVSAQGILLGAHRYYSHKSYKVKLPLRVLLVLLQTAASQNCMWIWVRDHRQHHKFSDTDADPHNASRGLFFSHIGWLMMKKHPEVILKGKTIDMSDLDNDPIVMFQQKYYLPLYVVFSGILPSLVPIYCWNESLYHTFLLTFISRIVIVLHCSWMVNSWAHAVGTRPYDKSIRSSETLLVSILSNGEGWHNYHHAFPWDYRASEFGLTYNPTTSLINFLAKIGWVYDLKQASDTLIKARALSSGDGSHHAVRKTSHE